MRQLDRGKAPVPGCLTSFQAGAQNWNDIGAFERTTIKASLEAMQGRCCAYCEGSLDALGHHIEHFRRRRDYPHLTFDWHNLFWSCDQKDSCGHHKDCGGEPYSPDDLVNPCEEDPDELFIFRTDGTISIRVGLQPEVTRRATETLRVFCLNPAWGRLRNMRQAAIAGYIKDADEAIDAGLSAEEMRLYFAEAVETAKNLPFYTAIKHILTER